MCYKIKLVDGTYKYIKCGRLERNTPYLEFFTSNIAEIIFPISSVLYCEKITQGEFNFYTCTDDD